jgi:hypothetical protein
MRAADGARGSSESADELLAGRIAAGDRAACAELYDRYARRVYAARNVTATTLYVDAGYHAMGM